MRYVPATNIAMALIRLAFWTAVFLLSTFAFTVLFEHGPSNYFDDAKKEWVAIGNLFGKKLERKPDGTDTLPH